MSATNDLTQLGVAAAAREIKERRLSSIDLIEAHLEQIKKREPQIGAWAYLNEDLARKQACAADTQLATGSITGPLHGVPVAIKDIIDTVDMPTQNGCPIFTGRQPKSDAPCVAALKHAGAVILGKTVTTELALLNPSETKNPTNIKHTPGGSSAGSAAAVADHMVPAALGTQTAGSILRPASYCGIYGFKPTRGTIPRAGVLMQSHTLDTVGVLTRSLEDTALLTQVMAANDPADDAAISLNVDDLVHAATTLPASPPRFAFVKTSAWSSADPALHQAFETFTQDLGSQCETIEIEMFEDIIEWQRIVQIAQNAFYYGPLLDKHPDLISKALTQRIKDGRAEPVTGYIKAIVCAQKAYAAVEAVLDRFHAIITPAAPGPAPRGLSSTGSPIFNGSWTYLGMPALSLPLLNADKMPLGVQIVAKRRADAHIMQTANWLEQHSIKK